ncbi:MAG: carbohydrate kinase family protein [Thermoplasmata archaeon]
MFDLICIGHLVFDIRAYVKDFPVPDKTTFTLGNMQTGGGGSANNVAVQARKLGLDVGIIGRVGFDDNGRFLFDNLFNNNIDASGIKIDPFKPTGMSIVIVKETGEVEIVEMIGANEPLFPEEVNEHYVRNTKWLHMTGTSIQALEKASEIAKKSGAKVSFDPGRSKSHLGYKIMEKVLENVDYLIVNRKEARDLLGLSKETDIIEVCSRLPEYIGRKKTYILKGGKEEIYVISEKGRFSTPTHKVDVVDTVGGGDSFAGGVIYALSKGLEIQSAVEFANRVASIKVARLGAQSGPSLEEMNRVC